MGSDDLIGEELIAIVKNGSEQSGVVCVCRIPVWIVHEENVALFHVFFPDVFYGLSDGVIVRTYERGNSRGLGDQVQVAVVNRDTKVQYVVDHGVERGAYEGAPHLLSC